MLRLKPNGVIEKVKGPTLLELDEKIDCARRRQKEARKRAVKEVPA